LASTQKAGDVTSPAVFSSCRSTSWLL